MPIGASPGRAATTDRAARSATLQIGRFGHSVNEVTVELV
jgi:hypothetical protein